MEHQETVTDCQPRSSSPEIEELSGAVGGMDAQCSTSFVDATEGSMQPVSRGDQPVTPEQPAAEAGSSSASTEVTGMDRLFLKQKNEIMYELRRLQLGDRPVSGQDSRKNLERFFTRNSAQSSDDTAAPADEHRPEAVIVEVQGLVQQRRVSSILSTAAFRRRLENAIRGHVTGFSRSPQPRPPQSRPATSSPVTVHSSAGNLATTASLSASSGSLNSILTVSSAGQSPDHTERPATPAGGSTYQPAVTPARVATIPPPPPMPAPEERSPRAAQWLQQQQPHVDGDHFWNNVEDRHREDFIAEMTDLVQRQLVTSTVQGDFGNQLESHLLNHIVQTGHDGTNVQSFIQSLQPSRPHVRNDFSHLGIETGVMNDNLDEISVISATAAVQVPYAQSQGVLRAEMQSLRTQMKELQAQMKFSLDLQMDIQRSIRQEVAAAFSQILGGATDPQPAHYTPPVRDSHCIICLDKHADCVLYQCGHLCVCNSCGLELKSRGSNCPVCRAPIRDVIRTYRSN